MNIENWTTHLGRNKIDGIVCKTYWKAFFVKNHIYLCKLHCSLLIKVQLTLSQSSLFLIISLCPRIIALWGVRAIHFSKQRIYDGFVGLFYLVMPYRYWNMHNIVDCKKFNMCGNFEDCCKKQTHTLTFADWFLSDMPIMANNNDL